MNNMKTLTLEQLSNQINNLKEDIKSDPRNTQAYDLLKHYETIYRNMLWKEELKRYNKISK